MGPQHRQLVITSAPVNYFMKSFQASMNRRGKRVLGLVDTKQVPNKHIQVACSMIFQSFP
jgi:hypothetical protein